MKVPAAALTLSTLFSLSEATVDKVELKRVIIVARHGNRTPNTPTLDLCPAYKPVLEGFGDLNFGQLTSTGMAELYECGALIRKLYMTTGKGIRKNFLPTTWKDDGTFFFQSERANRNLVSSQAFVLGMFPLGTGPKGFLAERPTLIPIQSTTAGLDEAYNNPRDGPCIARNKLEAPNASAILVNEMTDEEKTKMVELAKACRGPDLLTISETSNGRFNTGSAAKIIMDALLFARNEGLDATLHGRFSDQELNDLRTLGHEWMMKSLFNTEPRVTTWAGSIPDKLMTLFDIRDELGLEEFRLKDSTPVKEQNKFAFLLAHRELLYALLKLFNLDLALTHVPKGYVPAGSSLQFEVYTYSAPMNFPEELIKSKFKAADAILKSHSSNGSDIADDEHTYIGVGVDVYFWRPSGIEFSNGQWKPENSSELLGMRGERIKLSLPLCDGADVCPLEVWNESLKNWKENTGSWESLCSPEAVTKLEKDLQKIRI